MTEHRPPSEQADRPAGYPVRRLLGQVLVDGEFISHYDLERALEKQKRTNEMLGEVLVGMGVLDPPDLKAALSVQGELASVKDAISSASGLRFLLGEILLTAKRITPEQLQSALDDQKQTGEKLGAVLVRRKYITIKELQAALAFQQHQGEGGASPSPFRLGEILVATNQITRDQLDRALARQKHTNKKIGELLIDSGYVAPHEVSRGLAIQKKLVTAALVAALSMAAAPGAAAQEASGIGPSAGRAAARIEVSATVLPRTSLTVRSQPRLLVITREDVLRGYVEVPAASRIEVNSNDPRGYLLVFEKQAGPETPFGEVIVEGLGRQVQIGPGGGWIPQTDARGPVAAELSYRFSLAKDARPGTYPWPLSLSARTL